MKWQLFKSRCVFFESPDMYMWHIIYIMPYTSNIWDHVFMPYTCIDDILPYKYIHVIYTIYMYIHPIYMYMCGVGMCSGSVRGCLPDQADRDGLLGGVGYTHVGYQHVYTSNMAYMSIALCNMHVYKHFCIWHIHYTWLININMYGLHIYRYMAFYFYMHMTCVYMYIHKYGMYVLVYGMYIHTCMYMACIYI